MSVSNCFQALISLHNDTILNSSQILTILNLHKTKLKFKQLKVNQRHGSLIPFACTQTSQREDELEYIHYVYCYSTY